MVQGAPEAEARWAIAVVRMELLACRELNRKRKSWKNFIFYVLRLQRYIILHYITLYYIILSYIIFFLLYYVMLCYVIVYYYYVMLCMIR